MITGVLESIEREEAKSLIERYGGKVTGNISKKTNYLVKGRDCGVSKCEKVCCFRYSELHQADFPLAEGKRESYLTPSPLYFIHEPHD